jgi:hypothetical protein
MDQEADRGSVIVEKETDEIRRIGRLGKQNEDGAKTKKVGQDREGRERSGNMDDRIGQC